MSSRQLSAIFNRWLSLDSDTLVILADLVLVLAPRRRDPCAASMDRRRYVTVGILFISINVCPAFCSRSDCFYNAFRHPV